MKLRVQFSKFGPIKYIGHLDMMRSFQKFIKSAGIPVKYTEGFSPHQILSFAAPLGVGTESESEYFDLEVTTTEGSGTFLDALNSQVSDGIKILGIYELPEHTKNAMASVTAAAYRIHLYDEKAASILSNAVNDFNSKEEVISVKETKTGTKKRNLKDAVYDILVKDGDLFFTCDASSGGNLKPGALLKGLFDPYGIKFNPWDYRLIRRDVYMNDPNGNRVPLIYGLRKL